MQQKYITLFRCFSYFWKDCFVEEYPTCVVRFPSKIGDGICDGQEYNLEACDWDGGDCKEWNLRYPYCNAFDIDTAGDGICQMELNRFECGWDGYDCIEYNSRYPNCTAFEPFRVGDGYCDEAYNVTDCGWDGGDCIGTVEPYDYDIEYPYCNAREREKIGDGVCNGGALNVAECGWDGGDCLVFNIQYPECEVEDPEGPLIIGNGVCDGAYNTKECGYDGYDCFEFHLQYPNCVVSATHFIGDSYCDGEDYNTLECGWDGGGKSVCIV